MGYGVLGLATEQRTLVEVQQVPPEVLALIPYYRLGTCQQRKYLYTVTLDVHTSSVDYEVVPTRLIA